MRLPRRAMSEDDFWGLVGLLDGEALLYAAEEAAGEDIETAFDYETGSNAEYWTPRHDDGPVERPLVAVLLRDLLQPLEGWDGETGEPLVEYAWPLWFPQEVDQEVSARADDLVRAGGGLPPEPAVIQVVVTLGLGDRWRLAPEVEREMTDAFGERVSTAGAELRQAEVRAWTAEQQFTGLLAVSARCLLAVLPADHGARVGLEAAAVAGDGLLPPSG